MSERIETVQNISAAQLQAGGFAFQLPEGASEEDQNSFNAVIENAKKNNLNLVLQPGVKVVDLLAKAPVVTPVAAPVAPAEPVATPTPVAAPEPTVAPVTTSEPVVQQPVVPQQQSFVMPQQFYQPAGQQFVYNPFGYQMPLPVVPQPVPPPVQYPLGFQVVMPQHIQPAPAKTEAKKE